MTHSNKSVTIINHALRNWELMKYALNRWTLWNPWESKLKQKDTY